MAPEDPATDDGESAVDRFADDSEFDLFSDDQESPLVPDDPSEGLAPEPPQAPDLSAADADPELRRRFWTLVLLFNVALFGMSLGAMLVGFEGRWTVGGAIFAAGAVAFARGWLKYRSTTAELDEGDDTDA